MLVHIREYFKADSKKYHLFEQNGFKNKMDLNVESIYKIGLLLTKLCKF